MAEYEVTTYNIENNQKASTHYSNKQNISTLFRTELCQIFVWTKVQIFKNHVILFHISTLAIDASNSKESADDNCGQWVWCQVNINS